MYKTDSRLDKTTATMTMTATTTTTAKVCVHRYLTTLYQMSDKVMKSYDLIE